MEACENYQKQSYRNRCRFMAADGVQELRFPVKHVGGSFSLPIKEIEVDYSTDWVVRTERSITTAYSSSAFFAYYKDQLFGILDSHPRTLWELDMRIVRFFMEKIGLNTEIRETGFFGEAGEPMPIHPKKPAVILSGLDRPYYQLFQEKQGFVPNLSVMDLLFNEGPAALDYLL